MNEPLSSRGQSFLNRRDFCKSSFLMGALPLMGLLSDDAQAGEATPLRPKIDAKNPYAARQAHHEAKAKQVLVITLPGAVSHVDTFDFKPTLSKFHGQKPAGIPAETFGGPTGKLANLFGILSRGENRERWCRICFRTWLSRWMIFVLFIPW